MGGQSKMKDFGDSEGEAGKVELFEENGKGEGSRMQGEMG